MLRSGIEVDFLGWSGDGVHMLSILGVSIVLGVHEELRSIDRPQRRFIGPGGMTRLFRYIP